ncbi:hypothetical protein QVD17_39857 [Tagetes erecta]|uniref:RWP-RK domain-containing protein n=1 Tax=Tagetes erecta TaxID=13708 RepID=A0AAD8JT52_TARER|nr:hypothetical protein QVD17_39857 [Tagetes erecta]
MVVDYIAPSEVTCNTTLKVLPPEHYKKILDVIGVESPKSSDPSQCKGSQSDSFSDDFDMNVSEFVEAFPNPPPQMLYESESLWVFCSQSKNNSSSADVGTPINIIHHKIISAFSNMESWPEFFGQFWVPVTIDDKLLLTTLDQPFSVTYLSKDFVMFRLCSEKYKYNLDVNKLDIEGDPMILSGGPANAFLNRFPTYFNDIEWFQLEHGDDGKWMISIMLPICFPSKSYCIGVLELVPQNREYADLGNLVLHAIDGIKEAGLDVYYIQDIIPYKIISGLKLAKEEIEEALKVVCESHNLALAQAWIACEDKSHVLLSSSLEDNNSKKLFAIKLTGYLYAEDEHIDLDEFNRLCDLTPRVIQGELLLDTLQDYESRCISDFFPDMPDDKEAGFFHNSSAFEICLRSIDTGDFDYAFEFIWVKHSNYIIFLEALLYTLKRCLPRFKFASGVDLGDELDVIVDEADKIKIFQGKRSSPMLTSREEGKKQMLVDYMTHSEETCKTTTKVLLEDIEKQLDLFGTESPPIPGETSSNNIFQEKTFFAVGKAVDKGKKPMVKCKTAEILLTREDIEKQFYKPMKEAAENLKVSLSTLKRKLRKLGILEWPRTKQ